MMNRRQFAAIASLGALGAPLAGAQERVYRVGYLSWQDQGSYHDVTLRGSEVRTLKPGEELFYDYGLIIDERYTPKLKKEYECRCGSKRCRGTMLAPKR